MKSKTLHKAAQKKIRIRWKKRGFEEAMAQMAADPAILAECAVITKDFTFAEADGLN